jgi:hypothetical protein
MPADDLISGIPFDMLRARVPACNVTFGIQRKMA